MSGLVAALPALLVALPLAVAALLAAVGRWLPRLVADTVALATAAACCAGAAWLDDVVGGGRVVVWLGGWQPEHGRSVGIALVADRMAAGMVVIGAGLTVAALVYSWRYLEDIAAADHVLLMALLAAITGLALAGDVFNAFVWLELMGIAAYALTGLRIEEPRSVHGALTFGIVNTLGASFSLLGIALLYARTGELNLAAIGVDLEEGRTDALVLVSCALLLSGVLVKAAAVPFHFWTADAEAVAPTPTCVLLSGAMVATGVYAVARWWWVVFDGAIEPAAMRPVLLGIGAVTALVGAVMCAGQRHVKRLLAYSTVSHVGIFLLGVALLDEAGVVGAATYVLGHACVKSALFMGTGVLLNRFETVDEHALYGRGRGMRVTGALFLVGGLGLAGLPAAGVWLGKADLDHAATSAHVHWIVAVTVVASALTAGAVLRVAARVFLGLGPDPRESGESESREQPETDAPLGRPPLSMLGPAWILLALSVVLSAVPDLRAGIATAAAAFVDTDGYRTAVLMPEASVPPATAPASEVWTLSGVGLGALSAALAVVVAVCGVWAASTPSAVRRALRPGRWALDGLHQLHQGQLGNQVAWVLLGVAAFGAVLTW